MAREEKVGGGGRKPGRRVAAGVCGPQPRSRSGSGLSAGGGGVVGGSGGGGGREPPVRQRLQLVHATL